MAFAPQGAPPLKGQGPAAAAAAVSTAAAWALACSLACAVVSLPFAVGSCCWPTLLGLRITPAGLWLCHAMQFAVMLTVLSNLVQYFVHLEMMLRLGGSGSMLSLLRSLGPVL